VADPRVSRLFRIPAGVLAIAAGAFLAVRPFAAVEVMALCVGLGLVIATLIELVQLNRERPAKLTLAICFTLAAVVVGLWQPVSLAGVGAVTGVPLMLAGGAELWSAALLANQSWPGLLNSPSKAGFWPSLLVGGAWIVLGSLAVVWVDRTLLPASVALGMYLLIAGAGLLTDIWSPADADHTRLAGRVLAIVLGSALSFAGIGLDDGRVVPGSFYGSGTVAAHAAGKLLRAESYTGGAAPGVVAARLLYVTSNDQGTPTVASATVYVPADRVTEQLPLVVWMHNSSGLSPSCAPSVQGLAANGMSFIDQVAGAGYALLAPDLPGLGVEGDPSYLIGQSEGRAVLDALRAARQLNGVRFGDAVLWGFGQGGHAALWAGLIRDRYAPELTLEGIAAMGPLTDLAGVLATGGGGLVRERIDAYLIGSYAQVYPEVDFNTYVRPSAWLRVRETAARCRDWPGPLLPWLRSLDSGPTWAQSATQGVLATRLATNRPDGRIPVPVLLAQGASDQVITKDVQDDYVAEQCRRGSDIDYRVYGELDHDTVIAADSPAVSDLLAWTADRFAGLQSFSNCG